jgi:hypothetical protein
VKNLKETLQFWSDPNLWKNVKNRYRSDNVAYTVGFRDGKYALAKELFETFFPEEASE